MSCADISSLPARLRYFNRDYGRCFFLLFFPVYNEIDFTNDLKVIHHSAPKPPGNHALMFWCVGAPWNASHTHVAVSRPARVSA